jgi:hypothetical protein
VGCMPTELVRPPDLCKTLQGDSGFRVMDVNKNKNKNRLYQETDYSYAYIDKPLQTLLSVPRKQGNSSGSG